MRRDTLKFGVHCCRSQKIEECAFKIQQVDQLLASMEVFIDSVMTQRKVAWNYIITLLKKRLPMNAQKVFTDHAFVHKSRCDLCRQMLSQMMILSSFRISCSTVIQQTGLQGLPQLLASASSQACRSTLLLSKLSMHVVQCCTSTSAPVCWGIFPTAPALYCLHLSGCQHFKHQCTS